VEASRRRIADPGYRQRLRRAGVAVRGPEQADEPPEAAQSAAALREKIDTLKRGAPAGK
jgi:hypothetical protein